MVQRADIETLMYDTLVGYSMRQPDGMATMAEERKHMRDMRQMGSQDAPPWEMAALDQDGNELYRTGSFRCKEEAQQECDAFDKGEAYWCDNIDDEVADFVPRKR